MTVDNNAIEIAVAAAGLFAGMIGVYVTLMVKIGKMETEIENLKKSETNQDEKHREILTKLDVQNDKMDRQKDMLNQIKVELEKKQNRLP